MRSSCGAELRLLHVDGTPRIFDVVVSRLPKVTDTARVVPFDVNVPTVGMRVRAILRPRAERTGDLNDILHFAPYALAHLVLDELPDAVGVTHEVHGALHR